MQYNPFLWPEEKGKSRLRNIPHMYTFHNVYFDNGHKSKSNSCSRF